jgi:hypothetical protein
MSIIYKTVAMPLRNTTVPVSKSCSPRDLDGYKHQISKRAFKNLIKIL